LPAPLMRSTSQCPGNWRSSISGGRMWILSMRRDLAAPIRSLAAARHALVAGVAADRRSTPCAVRPRAGHRCSCRWCFVRHAMLVAFGVDPCQHQRDLLGRPALTQQVLHEAGTAVRRHAVYAKAAPARAAAGKPAGQRRCRTGQRRCCVAVRG
jgi:hypothetical protein